MWQVQSQALPGGPLMRVKPPSPYSDAEAVIAWSWLWFIFDLVKIRNPTGKAFPPEARGSNFNDASAKPSLVFALCSDLGDMPLACLSEIFPSSKYFVSGIVSARINALNSLSAFYRREWRQVSMPYLKNSCNSRWGQDWFVLPVTLAPMRITNICNDKWDGWRLLRGSENSCCHETSKNNYLI